jgi:hypothetical protein
VKRLLFLPAMFRGQEASLMLAFPAETELSMQIMLSRLGVR